MRFRLFLQWLVLSVPAAIALALPAPAENAASSPIARFAGRPVAPREVLVRMRTGAGAESASVTRRTLGALADADSVRAVGDGSVLRLCSRRLDPAALIRRLTGVAGVAYAEPNYLVQIARVPNDPYFWSLWGLENTGQTVNQRRGVAGADIRAPLAWDITTGTADSIVAIVDTGIDYRHPDLAANVWTAPRAFPVTIGGITVTCPEGAHGYNALANSFDPLDDNNHGTHCAGTVGAVGDDGYGITGVNWTTRLMGLKFLDAGGNGTAADAINALEFAIQARLRLQRAGNVRVLSNSWTVSGPSEALREQIEKADLNEMLFVAASGNSSLNLDETPAYPQSYLTPNMVNVAATGMADTLAGFSNVGAGTVDLAAPGFNVISTVRNGGYASFDGTSMAAPHVAGTAALMLAVDDGLSVGRLKSGLLGGVDPQPSLQGVTRTGGRLNAFAAVRDLGPRLDFRIDLLSQPLISVAQGDEARYDVLVSTTQSYGGDVTLSLEGLPPGAAVTPQVIGGGGVVSLLVRTGPQTRIGSHLLTLRATGGELSHSLTVSLDVRAAPVLMLSAAPTTRRVSRAGTARYGVQVTYRSGYRGLTTLSVAGLPPGCAARFGRSRIRGSMRVPLVVGVTPAAVAGVYPLTIRAETGGETYSAGVTLIIGPGAALTAHSRSGKGSPAGE